MSNLIYLHRNKINQKVYIGRTCHINNPNLRWQNGIGYKKQPYFFKDIIKFGWDNFEHVIVETNIPDNKIAERENYWILFYQANNPVKGYNQSASGSVSSMTRNRMKKTWENNPGRKKQQKELMTTLNKTISRKGQNNSMYGKSRTGKNAGRKRKVLCLETNQVFETLTEASKWCNPNGSNLRSHIAAQIQGKRKSCGTHPDTKIPLHWKYIDD